MATLPSTEAISSGEIRAHLDRILKSETLRKAPNLCHLLDYVVTKWAEGHSHQIKESVIAIEVFGRRADFDGRIDNIVRVQAHRLRKLLETYYAEEGRHDVFRLCIPRGSYVPQIALVDQAESTSHGGIGVLTSIHSAPSPEVVSVLAPLADVLPATVDRPALPPVLGSEVTERVTQPEAGPPRKTAQRFGHQKLASHAAVFLAGAVLAGLVTLHFAAMPGFSNPRLLRGSDRQLAPAPAVAEVWNGIFEPDVKTIIAYTSPIFLRVGRSQAFLLYHGPLSAPEGTAIMAAKHDPYLDKRFLVKGQKLYFSDGWTGMGEVLGVNRLTALAAQFRQSPNVLPSRVLTLNEARGSNVIFIGASGMNGMIAKIGTESAPLYNTGDGHIILRQPAPRERASYENLADPVTGQIKVCYALFSVLPGVDNSRKIVTSAGLGSWATWGAIDFLSTSNGASQLVEALEAENRGSLPRYYQAVIRSEIIDGSVTNPALMTTRVVLP
jgi:hypothetical protein